MGNNQNTIIIACAIVAAVVVLVLLIVLAFILIKNRNKNKSKLTIDEDFINNIFGLLGNKDNIKTISVDNARLKFEVLDLNKVDLTGLKELSQNGVFVTGSNVKTLFKYDSLEIKKQMERGL